jgi:GABA permease
MGAPPAELKKGLKQRHLTMIAMGGVIGAGLFVGSGTVISEAGPSAFLSYAVTGVLIILVMRMLGEMATANPSTGSFADYARQAIVRFGVVRGSLLALKRLARCHPLGSHGFDPVP